MPIVAVVALLIVPTFGLASEMRGILERCSPNVHVTTMGSIVSAESSGNPVALLDNDRIGKPRSERVLRSFRPQSTEEAMALANQLIADGHSVDIGLGQVNSLNMKILDVTVADLLDPCKNLKAAETVLLGFYERAAKLVGSGPKALEMALSGYNTGNFRDGIANGYVRRVLKASAAGIPPLRIAPPFAGGVRVAKVGHGVATGSRGVLTQRPTLLAAKLASIDVERF